MTHDVSAKLREIESDLPGNVRSKLDRLCDVSKSLRRDRELAFDGSEDVTPSEFYDEKAARKALAELDEVLAVLPS